jgi:hypothetical protein
MAQFDLKNAVLKIKDGTTPTANELTIVVGEGNLSYTERVNREYINNRGVIHGVRDGDEEPLDVSLEFMWEFLRANGADPPTVEDALKKRGNASSWATSGTDVCEPYCVDIEIVYTPVCAGVDAETILLNEFRYEELEHDLRGGTVSVTGKCKIKEATVSRG